MEENRRYFRGKKHFDGIKEKGISVLVYKITEYIGSFDLKKIKSILH